MPVDSGPLGLVSSASRGGHELRIRRKHCRELDAIGGGVAGVLDFHPIRARRAGVFDSGRFNRDLQVGTAACVILSE